MLLENGRIVSIRPERRPATKAQPVKDYGDSVIMPGLIDSHVRMDEPGHSDWEGFEYATAAAAAGGITTVIDLPLDCNPVTTNLDALKSKIRAADGNLTVNCGFWGGIIPTNQEQIEPMAKAGVFGFCLFLSDSGNADFPTIPVSDLERIAPRLAATNLPIGFHAVLPSGKSGKLKKPKDEYSYKAFLESLPDSFETEAAKEIIKLCTKHALDAHLLHVSSSEVLPMIEQARKKVSP
ncbi:MAG: amidohydrolase family protein, partial [Flavobacteriales bacterium]